MAAKTPLLASQRVVQVCLFLVSAIALFGGPLQMYLGEPENAARLDNVHRFMAGVYFGSGLIALWAALTIRQHRTLVFLIALSVFLAGTAGVDQPGWIAATQRPMARLPASGTAGAVDHGHRSTPHQQTFCCKYKVSGHTGFSGHRI